MLESASQAHMNDRPPICLENIRPAENVRIHLTGCRCVDDYGEKTERCAHDQ